VNRDRLRTEIFSFPPILIYTSSDFTQKNYYAGQKTTLHILCYCPALVYKSYRFCFFF